MKICNLFLWSFLIFSAGYFTAETCLQTDNESVLHPEYDYTYRYQAEALAEAVGTTNDRSKIRLDCNVIIKHAHSCFYNLQLQQCTVTGTGGSPESESSWYDHQPLSELIRHSVLFSLKNGEIEEIRTHEEDPIHFVNIKRGVLSGFVFKLSQVDDQMKEDHTDVHGTCPLTSKPVNVAEGYIKTSKDMSHCAFPSRTDWQLSPWSLFWNMSFIQYVINSTTDCDYNIEKDAKIIGKVICKERHAIMLESNDRTANAVQTNVYYTMIFVKSEKQKQKPDYSSLTRKTGITYEYERTPDPASSPTDFLAIAKKMLSDLVEDSIDEIRLFTIPQFTDFVGWIRSADDLLPLLHSMRSCSFLPRGALCSKEKKDLAVSYLSDALIQCNTLPCTKAIAQLIKNDNLSPAYLNFVFYSWSNIHVGKSEFLKSYVDICRIKDSSLCWLAVGTMTRRIHARNQTYKEMFKELKEVASHFYRSIGPSCEGPSFDSKSDKYSHYLMYLKAIANMGELYSLLIPNAANQLTECVRKTELPLYVKTSSLETLKEITNCQSQMSCSLIYERLLPIFLNSSFPSALRILAYDELLLISEEHTFELEILKILEDEDNMQLIYYIASNLHYLLSNTEFRRTRNEFVVAMKKLLKEKGISLESIIQKSQAKSKRTDYRILRDLSFLPNDINKFGSTFEKSKIYETDSVLPLVFRSNILLKAFSNIVPMLQYGGYIEGIEEIGSTFQKIMTDMNSNTFSLEKIYRGLEKIIHDFGNVSNSTEKYNFNETVVANIRKLEEMFHKKSPKLEPFIKIYFDLFGSTSSFFTSKDIELLLDKLKKSQGIINSLNDGETYNVTRVIRFIEAYHQVPTLMGLPLNWTTNATLAFSIKTGLKVQQNVGNLKFYSTGYFQPSAALTFLNRMVLDFPTLTQIGVQANSSAYTSTQWKADYSSSTEKRTFKIEKPARTQKILQLFRTNQIIKHNNYADIPDWDIERISSSWCSKDPVNSISGLKFCLDKSYPDVTQRSKPWALMAGWCKWQFTAVPFDEKSKSYDMEYLPNPKPRSKDFFLKFSITGTESKRDLYLNFETNRSNEDFKLEMKAPDFSPDFLVSFSKSAIIKRNRHTGHQTIAMLKLFKDYQYQFIHHDEDRAEKLQDDSTNSNKSPKTEKTLALVHEKVLSFQTPYNNYIWNKKIYTYGESKKVDVHVSYQNLVPKKNWLTKVLPQTFWETGSKAWIQFQIHWKNPIHYSEDIIRRQTALYVISPDSTLELNANSVTMKGSEQIILNLTKTETANNKLSTFANFSYEFWESENGESGSKVIRLFNLTIPLRSWSLQFQKVQGAKLQHEVILKRARMWPKNDEKTDYVGWWNNDLRNDFNIQEYQIKLFADTEISTVSGEALAEKYSTLSKEDVSRVENELIVSNIALHYPLFDREETLTFDGYFILSAISTTFRFQKNFVMESSYNNLRLTSHSVYKKGSDLTSLSHNAFFTHTISEKQAMNIIEYKKTISQEMCDEIYFKHDIKSHVFDLSTNATYKCDSKAENLHTLLLTTSTNSSYWDMLNTTLSQVIRDVSSEYSREDVTFTHPMMTITVFAEWLKKATEHKKIVTFCAQGGNCPSAKLRIESSNTGEKMVKLLIPSLNETQLSYERKMFSNFKSVNVKIKHSDKDSKIQEVLDFTGDIISENYQIWKTIIDMNRYRKIEAAFTPSIEKIKNTVNRISKDPNHPLNSILKLSLKMTLYEFWEGLQKQNKELIQTTWSSFKEILNTLEPIYNPVLHTLSNAVARIDELCTQTYNALKDKSITLWAINYFNLPHYFRMGIMNLPRGYESILQKLFLDEQNVMQFRFTTGKVLRLNSFREWPSVSLEDIHPPFLKKDVHEIKSHRPAAENKKIAMIFGPLHVYTFDGYLYDAPRYPKDDCLFLLAHDRRKSLFTVLSSANTIYILFPETTVAITENDVFINGSNSPSHLPFQANNKKVIIKKDDVIEIWSPSLIVTCRSKDFLCLLELSNWHGGGTFGLLGNADGASYNEYMLPDGEITSDLLEFAREYEVSGKAECKNLELNTKYLPSDEEKEICSTYISNLCPKMKDVNNLFFNACISDVTEKQDACYSASGLSALCFSKNKHGFSDCNIRKQENEGIVAKLEVVFLVYEHISLADKHNAPYKGLESLIRNLDEKFKSSGYSSVLYSVIGYGGKGLHYQPSVHSVESNIWVPVDVMVNDMLKTLDFKGKEEADTLGALNYGLEVLGYDTFDSKIFIVVTDSDSQDTSKEKFEAIKHHLEANGITLYTFASYPSIEKGKKVYGVRADGLIFPSHTTKEKAYIDYPKGALAKLTSGTRGSLFLYKFLKENSPVSYFTEFAEEVWSKVRKETQDCRECKSVKSGWWWYKNECNIVHC